MEKCLKELQDKIVCRNKEISTLYSLISSPTSMPQSLFVLGHMNTGKSLVICNVLEHLDYNFAIIDCIENPSLNHLLERILSVLLQNVLKHNPSENENQFLTKCNNMEEFIINLKNITSKWNSNIVIVFENCSRLRDLDVNVLPAFVRLKELSKVNVCTIFVSDIIWEKFKIQNEMAEPIKVYFPQYTRYEILEILLFLAKKEGDVDDEFYKHYLELFLNIYYRFCRDLLELHYMAQINFNFYMNPIKSGECKATDRDRLYRKILPIFKANLEVIYSRTPAEQIAAHKSNFMQEVVQSLELPYYSKFLLIAAFLASYISPKLDKRLFSVMGTRTKKRRKTFKQDKIDWSTATPNTFDLDRMLGIFCFIVAENVDVNAILLTQISTLCRLGLMIPIGTNRLDEPKYKCCVDLCFISAIAHNVNLNIMSYLNVV